MRAIFFYSSALLLANVSPPRLAPAQTNPAAAPPLPAAGVGKTCLLLRYANNSFSPTFITTIGIDFKIKTISVDDKRIKLQVRRSAPAARARARATLYAPSRSPHTCTCHTQPIFCALL